MSVARLQPAPSAAAFTFEELDAAGGRIGVVPSAAAHAASVLEVATAEAEREAAAIREQAHAEGYAAGLAAAETQIAPMRDTLAAITSELTSEREALLGGAEARAVELALAIAEKVVGAALEVKPELVLSTVTGALRRVAERDHVVIEVNPDDLDLVERSVGDVLGSLGGFGRVEVIAERRVGRGGCVVRTREVEIDARLEEQLARAREALLDDLHGNV
jgi:flagellar biosynthesis/type III secretory pathway protein FliH